MLLPLASNLLSLGFAGVSQPDSYSSAVAPGLSRGNKIAAVPSPAVSLDVREALVQFQTELQPANADSWGWSASGAAPCTSQAHHAQWKYVLCTTDGLVAGLDLHDIHFTGGYVN